jgi:hypothetical protein
LGLLFGLFYLAPGGAHYFPCTPPSQIVVTQGCTRFRCTLEGQPYQASSIHISISIQMWPRAGRLQQNKTEAVCQTTLECKVSNPLPSRRSFLRTSDHLPKDQPFNDQRGIGTVVLRCLDHTPCPHRPLGLSDIFCPETTPSLLAPPFGITFRQCSPPNFPYESNAFSMGSAIARTATLLIHVHVIFIHLPVCPVCPNFVPPPTDPTQYCHSIRQKSCLAQSHRLVNHRLDRRSRSGPHGQFLQVRQRRINHRPMHRCLLRCQLHHRARRDWIDHGCLSVTVSLRNSENLWSIWWTNTLLYSAEMLRA